MSASSNSSILGPPSLTAGQIIDWYNGTGHGAGRLSCTIAQLIGWYIQEGADQGVRGDVAFAQAVWETGFFASPDTALNNFAGIAHPDNAPSGTPFASPQTGARAHIQLLAEVVGGNGITLAHSRVAPTWGGRQASTWQGLTGNWASDPTYDTKVFSIYNAMLGGGNIASGPTGGGTTPTAGPFGPSDLPGPSTLPVIASGFRAAPTIDALVFNGQALGAGDVAGLVTGGAVDLAHDRISEFTFTAADPDLSLAARIGNGVDVPAVWGDPKKGLILTSAVVEVRGGHAGPEVMFTLRESIGEWMMRDKVARSETSSPADFIARRVAEYNLMPGVTSSTKPIAAFNGQQSPSRLIEQKAPSGQPHLWESTYAVCRRLATEEGFWFYESAGAIWFGDPTWLVSQGSSFAVGWRGSAGPGGWDSIDVPNCSRSLEVITGDVVVVTLAHDVGEQVRVGMAMFLTGIPGFSPQQPYLVVRVRWSHNGFATPVEVTAWQPIKPTPVGTTVPPAASQTGTGSALDFVTALLSQVGKRYSYGYTPLLTDPNPSAFDCSSFVQWAAAQVGVSVPRTSGAQYAAAVAAGTTVAVADALTIRGALVFLGAGGSEHVAVSLGDGRNFVEAANSQVGVITGTDNSKWTAAALVPGMNYGSAATHPTGAHGSRGGY